MLIRKSWMDRIGPFNEDLKHGDSAEWIQRAEQAGASRALVEEVMLFRRLHRSNFSAQGEAESRSEFLDLLKARIDRRRRSGSANS